MTQTTNLGLKKVDGTDNWRTIFAAHNDSMEAAERVVSRKVIMPSSPIGIPASDTVFYNMEGITIDHVVDKWQFSVSAENNPPCDITVITYDGYFSITTSGSASETIQPIFIIPTTSAATVRNSET